MFGFLGGLFGFVSITTMALMSIERYLIVKNPLNSLKLNEKFMLGILLYLNKINSDKINFFSKDALHFLGYIHFYVSHWVFLASEGSTLKAY